MTKIVVKPVPRESVQRRHLTPVKVWDPLKRQMVDTGQVSGKNKAKDSVEKLPFTPDREKRRYKTGLEEMLDNPFKGMDWLELKASKALPDEWNALLPKIVEMPKISKQQYFELLDGVIPDFYTPIMHADTLKGNTLFGGLDAKREKTFIERFEITLYDGANVFHSDTSRGRFAIQLLKNCGLVAPNREVSNSNYHNWYIAEENEEELDRVKSDDLENLAIYELAFLQNNYPEGKLYQLAGQLTTHENAVLVKGDVSHMLVKDQLNRYIKNKGPYKAENISKFMTAVDNFKNNPLKWEIDYLTAQAFATNLLYIESGFLYWRGHQDQPQVYKWKNMDAFKAFIFDEGQKYDPNAGNSYYADLIEELRLRGVPLTGIGKPLSRNADEAVAIVKRGRKPNEG